MRQRIAVNRVRALLFVLSFLALLSVSPLIAFKETPVLHTGNEMQLPSAQQTLVLSERIIRSSMPLANANCFMRQHADETGCAPTEEVRRDILCYLLLLLYISFWMVCCRLWRHEDSPPPLIQQRALLRFLKRADGRKRLRSACPQWRGEGVFAP